MCGGADLYSSPTGGLALFYFYVSELLSNIQDTRLKKIKWIMQCVCVIFVPSVHTYK